MRKVNKEDYKLKLEKLADKTNFIFELNHLGILEIYKSNTIKQFRSEKQVIINNHISTTPEFVIEN